MAYRQEEPQMKRTNVYLSDKQVDRLQARAKQLAMSLCMEWDNGQKSSAGSA